MPKREHYIFVCLNRRPDGSPKGSCAARGSEEILQRLKALLADRRLNYKLARACSSSCLDLCHAGPSMTIQPDGIFYGHVTVDDLPEIVDALEQGKVVERLRLRPEQFDPPR